MNNVAKFSSLEDQLSLAMIRKENALADLAILKYEDKDREMKYERVSGSENRTFYFGMPIVEQAVAQAQSVMMTHARMSDDPITIILNSPGGSVFAGLAFIDAIEETKNKGIAVNIVVRGIAASMAAVVLQAGTERVIGPNSYLMVHEVSNDSGNQEYSKMLDTVALTKRLQDRSLGMLAKRSTYDIDTLSAKWERKDWWLDADEALAAGFVDRIG